VTLTDQHCLLFLLEENKKAYYESAAIDPSDDSIQVEEYKWEEELNKELLEKMPFDIVIVSDCVLPKLYPIDILLDVIVLMRHEPFLRIVTSHGLCLCRRW
jgi:hypothetical protein